MNLIAIKMLVGDRIKYLGMIVGVVIASFLMNQQLSIFWGLMSRTYGFITDTSYPDLWVMDDKVQFVDDAKPMQDTALYRVRGIEGVAWAVPMYKGMIRARLDDGTFQNCIVIGVDDATLIGGPPTMLHGQLADLRRADGVIVDNNGRQGKLAKTNADGTKRPVDVGDSLELNDHRAIVVGVCNVSRTFQSQPVVYTTYSRAMTFAPRERKLLSFVLIGVKPGADHAVVAERVRKATGLAAYSQQQFAKLTFNYFMRETGIPINFAISTALGFVVGAAIVALLFYMFTHDNLKNLGALKAMGTSNAMLMRMTLLQAALVGVIGYGIGIGLAAWMGFATANSELAFSMVWWIPAITSVAVMFICLGSAAAAIFQVFRLEPAVVFKG
jgi:putative ABC transport system permease protein